MSQTGIIILVAIEIMATLVFVTYMVTVWRINPPDPTASSYLSVAGTDGGAEAERAAVVIYLREQAAGEYMRELTERGDYLDQRAETVIRRMAQNIEAGEHRSVHDSKTEQFREG
jgi:hypothetical protein